MTNTLLTNPSLVDHIADSTLTICECDGISLRSSISRLALSDSTDASSAVLQAMLAVASVHRDGHQVESFRLQGRALRALKSSVRKGVDDSEIVQHLAANLLLCMFEVGTLAPSRPKTTVLTDILTPVSLASVSILVLVSEQCETSYHEPRAQKRGNSY